MRELWYFHLVQALTIILFVVVQPITQEVGNGLFAGPKLFEEGLVGYWKLQGDCKDYSGNGNNGINHNVDLTYSEFNGRDSYIEIPNSSSLNFGTGNFTISTWIFTENDLYDVIGDILSKYDAVQRKGFTFYVKSSSGVYNAQGNSKHVYFGIDNARESEWEDCGRPAPTSNYCTSLTVYNGKLYVGNNYGKTEEDWSHVYSFEGGQTWKDCGRVGNLRTTGVSSLIVHNGKLYASNWSTKSSREGKGRCDYARIYCYEGDNNWRDCGQPGNSIRVKGLASYKGKLYAVSDDKTGGFFKCFSYEGGTEWIMCGKFRGFPNCMNVHDGKLFTGGAHYAEVHAFDGELWECLGNPSGSVKFGFVHKSTQIYVLEVHRGKLYCGTWPFGMVARYKGPAHWKGLEWEDCGRLGESTEINDLTMYNGKFYAGAFPWAEVYRYEEGKQWTLIQRFLAPEFGWKPKTSRGYPTIVEGPERSRITSLTVYDGKLFATVTSVTGSQGAPIDVRGKVFSMEAGKSLSYDYDLGAGWKHLVAVRDGNRLKLYVNGQLEVMSSEFIPAEYDITNDEPLKIGFGEMDYFTGNIREVRLYKRALEKPEIKSLYNAE